MNKRTKGRIALLLILSLVLVNINPYTSGEKDISIIPVYAEEPAPPVTPAPENSIETDLGFKIMDVSSHANYTGGMIEMDSSNSSISLVVTGNDNVIPLIENVEWKAYDNDDLPIISISKKADSDKGRMATLTAINPGYSSIWVTITYNGLNYDIMCQVHVTLDIATAGTAGGNPLFDNINGSEWRGMKKGGIFTADSEYNLQLSTNDASDTAGGVNVGNKFSHYLVKIKNVSYEAGVDYSTTVTSNPDGILSKPAALEWISSDHSVCTVDENGIITAVGAGYAVVTVTTKTSGTVNNKKVTDSVKINVIVAPTAKLLEEPPSSVPKAGNLRVVVPAKTFTFETNAVRADNLVWTIRKADASGNEIDIKKNDYMTVDISSHSGVITLSNVKAGVYYITAKTNDKYLESLNNTSYLKITVIVPLFINSNPVVMNVGDSYDILNNSNLPDKSVFSYSIVSGGSNIINLTNGTIIKGISQGETGVKMTYQFTTDNIYAGLPPEEIQLIKDYSSFDYAQENIIPVKVIDGISLSTTSAIIYVGHEFQLNVNASNQYSAVTWTSSDESIATVNEDGVIKGIKPGDVIISAAQVINGVTKTASCEIKVVQTITQITLDPSNKELEIGSYLTINAAVKPASTGASLYWVSSDESIVKVTSSNKLSATVQALKGGTAVISAINQDNVVVGSCMIKVYEPITGVTLSESNVTLSLADKRFQLYATVLPATAEDRAVVWKSTDESVIKVDNNGNVTLVKSGKAAVVVTAKENSSIMAICNVTVTKSVTGIKLDTTTKAMYVGETFRLSYVLSPSDASNSAVTWSSTNASIATVDATGLISAKSVGTTTIIAKTTEGGYMAMCTVTVSRTATAVKLDATKLTLNVGDSYLFETVLTPADSTETALSWESSDTSVAVISKRGKVTAKKAGTCIILVKTKSGSTGYCTVIVYQGATGIEISSEEETISVGDTLELEAEIVPASSSNQGITWSSNKPEVASVNNKGEVKGLQGGTAIITCKATDGGYIAACIVTVEEMINSITLNKTSYKLGVGKTFKLVAEIAGVNATNKQVSFSSSSKSVVTVNDKGVIKGVKIGTATITCSAEDGSGEEAYCEVEVVNLVTDLSLNESYLTLIQGKSFTLKAAVTPKNATYSTPVWSSSDPETAIVSKKGVITALKPGDCMITATADDSSEVSSICYVKVIAPVASSGVTPQESEVVMSPGETKTVGISITPTNSTDTYTWSSDNAAVASVNEKTGKITAVALGTANITVMTESGRKASIKVYVVGLSRTYVELQQYTNLLLKLEVDGTNTAGLKVRWDVDNQEIATVVNGNVTARALGTTTVYAVVNGRRLACTVKVVKIK